MNSRQPHNGTILQSDTSIGRPVPNHYAHQYPKNGQDISSRQANRNMSHPQIANSSSIPNNWMHQYPRSSQNIAFRQSGDGTIPQKSISNNRPVPNYWVHQCPFLETVNPLPPRYPVPLNNCDAFPRPMESPKTPPSSLTASHRRRCTGSEHPMSPPNPLRLASTTAQQHLPRPEVRYLRSTLTLLNFDSFCTSVGDPCFQVFKARLPDYLINGPLDELVEASEQYVNRLPNGWRTNLYTLTKCDIACKAIPGISSYIKQIVEFVSLTMKMLYGCRDITMDHNQPHILKYSAKTGHTGGKVACFMVDNF